MATTTNYSWSTPDDTALVKDGAAAIRSLGTAIDSTVFTNAGAAIAKTIVDAKGDIIAATASDTVSRLAVGANDTVLTADSSTATGLKWSAPASGGMTLISTTTLTGSSVTLSSIPTDYKNLQLVIRNYRPATDNTLRLRMNSDSNANRHVDIGNQTNEPFISTFFEFGNNTDGDAASQSLHIADIIDYANTTTWKLVFVISINNNNSTNTNAGGNFTLKAYNQIPAITSLVLFPASGNFTSGTALLYGVK